LPATQANDLLFHASPIQNSSSTTISQKAVEKDHGIRHLCFLSTYESDPVRVVLPFKDLASADILRGQLKDLSQKIGATIQPVFVSHKIEQVS